MAHITVAELALWQAQGFDFELLDVRRAAARTEQPVAIGGARWLDPALWLDWKDGIGTGRPVVLVCARGHEISQGLCAALRVMGVDARWLVGGQKGWREAGGAVLPV
jgi:rhodanese-related sulfurtransferase